MPFLCVPVCDCTCFSPGEAIILDATAEFCRQLGEDEEGRSVVNGMSSLLKSCL